VAHGGSIPTARLYTRTGDGGETGLVGGSRVAKDSERIRAYGAMDELAAHLGLAEALLPPGATESRSLLQRLGHELFVAMSELATPPGKAPLPHRIEARHVQGLEAEIDRLEDQVPPLKNFVLPRGTAAAAEVHVARTVARRAERDLWRLHRTEPVRPELLQWTNRLSDLLFALARVVNHAAGESEIAPDYST
jgi:cob(I)alamin adenosyltransferase